MPTLSQMFQESMGAPIHVGGASIVPIFQVDLPKGNSALRVDRLRTTPNMIQGLRIKVKDAAIELNGEKFQDIVLWSDTSPANVDLIFRANQGGLVKFWNVWRLGELVQSWVGDAGIVVLEKDRTVTLRCSGGKQCVDFDSFVVQLSWT